MAHKTNSFERFWKELKRRKVVHVITVYAAIAFVILELVSMITQPLKLPEWTEAFVIVLLCIGFVIAVFVSWVYDITPVGVKKTKPVSELKHSDHTTHAVSSGWKIAIYLSAFIILALVAFNLISRRNLNADILRLEKSIAVLPFINESPVDSNKHFINGVMEEILNNLQSIKEFRVLSRTSTDQYKGLDRPTIPEIAKKLGVSYIVEGSGQKYGNTFTLRAQLIRAKGKETHIWGKTYNEEIREVRDYVRIQSEIAQSIARELKAAITPEERQIIDKIPTENLTAYSYYQRGREDHVNYWNNVNDKDALMRAEDCYHKALESDSEYAKAYAGLALVYFAKNLRREYFTRNYLDSSRILAEIALKYDNKTPEANVVLGDFYREKGEIEKALEEYNKAIRINPSLWEAYRGKAYLKWQDDYVAFLENSYKALSLAQGTELYSMWQRIFTVLVVAGFPDLAMDKLKLSTDSIMNFVALGYIEDVMGNYTKSNEYYKKAYSIDSSRTFTLETNNILSALGASCMATGNFKESLKYFKKYVELLKVRGEIDYNNMHRIGYSYYKNGNSKEAEYYFNLQMVYCNDLINSNRPHAQKYYTYYDRAGIYAFRGEKEKAYADLRVFNQRKMDGFWMVTLIKNDRLFDSIRNEPEFQQIVRDVEVKYQAEHERVKKWLEEQGMLN